MSTALPRIARFEKVSPEQFILDSKERFPALNAEEIMRAYERIELPRRATAGSSGYDIRTPFSFTLSGGQDVTVPTGLRVWMEEGWCLLLMPRSGLGFRLYTRLANTLGNIDSDYYLAKNEGHMSVKLRVEKPDAEPYLFEAGSAFCQGVFVPFGITVDDDAQTLRTGGFGSTGR